MEELLTSPLIFAPLLLGGIVLVGRGAVRRARGASRSKPTALDDVYSREQLVVLRELRRGGVVTREEYEREVVALQRHNDVLSQEVAA